MTMLWLLLSLITVAFAFLVYALTNLWRRETDGNLAVPAELARRPVTENARAMTRLFAPRDFEFLRQHPCSERGMIARLRSQRRKSFHLFLVELRREFRHSWKECRRQAATSKDPNFAANMTEQWVRFQLMFFVLRAQFALSRVLPVEVNVGELAKLVQGIRLGVEPVWRRAELTRQAIPMR